MPPHIRINYYLLAFDNLDKPSVVSLTFSLVLYDFI